MGVSTIDCRNQFFKIVENDALITPILPDQVLMINLAIVGYPLSSMSTANVYTCTTNINQSILAVVLVITDILIPYHLVINGHHFLPCLPSNYVVVP